MVAVELEQFGEQREDEGEGNLATVGYGQSSTDQEMVGCRRGARTRSSSSDVKSTLSTFLRSSAETGGEDGILGWALQWID